MNKIVKFLTNKKYVIITIACLIASSFLLYFMQLEIDITRNNSNSITKESKIALKELKVKNVDVTFLSAIASPTTDSEVLKRVNTVFKRFRKYNKNIKYEIIDLANNPDEFSNYEYIDPKGAIIINYNGKQIIIPSQSYVKGNENELIIDIENILIKELVKLQNENNYNIYYTSTHREEITNDEYSSYSNMLTALGYNLLPLDLTNDEITNDIKCIIILAPNTDFSPNEISKLENLVTEGTNIYISLKSTKNNISGAFYNLKNFVSKYGVIIEDSIIVDQIQETKLIGVYENLENNEKFIEKLNSNVYLPNSRKITLQPSKIGITNAIMYSGELSSNEDNKNYSSSPLIVRIKDNNSRIVLSASSDMINDSNIQNNKKFIIFLCQWLENSNLDIFVKPFVYTEYITNPNDLKSSLVFGIIRIIIPCCILFLGLEMKIQREKTLRKSKIREKHLINRKMKRK